MPISYAGPNPSSLATIVRPTPAPPLPARPSYQVSHGPPANVTNPGGGSGSGGGFKNGNPGCCCGSGTSVTIPGCPCTSSPAVIDMHSSKPESNNNIFQSARLVYGPTPSALLPVVLTSSSYLSDSSYPDPILNVPFFYFLTCTINSYVLTRVYVSSPFGSPFRDSVRYKWVPGFPGNDCTPFVMTNGQIFLGGDPTCIVTLAAGT